MAKRMTDTEKWRDPWFAKLDSGEKLFWLYLLDTCNHAGIWKDGFGHFEYTSGCKINLEKFKDRLIKLNDETYFIPNFLKYQYPDIKPGSKSNVLRGIESALGYYGLNYEELYNSFKKGYLKLIKTSPVEAASVEIEHKEKKTIKSSETRNKEVIDLFNEITGSKFKYGSANLEFVNARFAEGYTKEDFEAVIKFKYDEWKSSQEYAKYIQPSTFFRPTNFENYLNQARREVTNKDDDAHEFLKRIGVTGSSDGVEAV